MTQSIIDGAFGLGLAGFILLIVLILVVILLNKITAVFIAIPEKFDNLTNELSDSNKKMTEQLVNSNKELSNQLTKTLVIQENILCVMKETIVTINGTSIKIALLENKVNASHEEIKEISAKTDSTLHEIKDIKKQLVEIKKII